MTTLTSTLPRPPAAPRHTYLDWLRLLCIAGVLFFHCAMPFAAGEQWHIRNAEGSELLLEFISFLHLFRMPLLFFISGAVSYFMMQRRSSWAFIGLRVRRLLLPLLFGMLVVVPPQIYMERLTQGFGGSYFDFYPSVFAGVPYPQGSTSWHHLWFIAYLFLYDVVFAPAFAWLAGADGQQLRYRLGALARGHRVYLLALPGVLWYAATARRWPQTNDLLHDGGFFVYWLLFVLVGFLCVAQPLLVASLERVRRHSLTIGFVAFLFLNYLRWNQLNLGSTPPLLSPLVAWSLVFAAVGYGRRYLQHPHRLLAYLNTAAYPFYILHQTVIVVLAYYVVKVPNESILGKYLFLVLTTLFVTMGIFHLLLRPVAPLRFLFGMKPKGKLKVKSEELKDTALKAEKPEPAYVEAV